MPLFCKIGISERTSWYNSSIFAQNYHMKNIIFLLIIGACFVGCREKSTLEKEVIAIHDEVMPKMGAIHLAKKKLRKVLSSSTDSLQKSNVLQMIADLDDADEGMMTWMADWDVPSEEPQKTKYLLQEKEKITKVKVDMLTSLQNANDFLDKMNSK